MRLMGHDTSVYSIAFDKSGSFLVSASGDTELFIWDLYNGCTHVETLQGHKNSVLSVEWTSDGSTIVSASADKTVSLWSPETGRRLRKLNDHAEIVNDVAVSASNPFLFASVSDDKSCLIKDTREPNTPQASFVVDYPLVSVALSGDGEEVVCSGVDGILHVFDVRGTSMNETLLLDAHDDIVTGLAYHAPSARLLSNGMDNVLKSWDLGSFVEEGAHRQVGEFQGFAHTVDSAALRCAWSADGEMVSCGSGDRLVHIWDVPSGEELYTLPGHQGTVNEVIFHPREPVVASCSYDGTIFVGELA
jgi:Prp8 binding protein